jgi:SAM-dependent methyltransferase
MDDVESADTSQVAFYLERARPAGSSILELGCGSGLLSVGLALAGAEVVAVDPSQKLIDEALERRRALGLPAERCRFERADLRALRLDRRFGLVCAPGNALAGLSDLDDLAAVFATARAHLEARGSFAFDVRVADEAAPEDPEEHGATLVHALRSRGPHLVERASAGEVVRRLSLLSLSGAQVEEALKAARFEPLEAWADFEGTPYLPDSERMVAVARPLTAARRAPVGRG